MLSLSFHYFGSAFVYLVTGGAAQKEAMDKDIFVQELLLSTTMQIVTQARKELLM